jgi:tRNA (mo5U34)-methyltransferase
VWSDGWFDLRPAIQHYGLPDDMTGLRALDVGTSDGFWAFEMERRGADVVAIDLPDERQLDWPKRFRPAEFPEEPRGAGFAIAKELRGSRVERIEMSIYDATPESLGTFDVVLCGSVIIHLRDQMRALEHIAGLCRETFISCEVYGRLVELLPIAVARFVGHRNPVSFWEPNSRAWERMIYAAGFDRVERRGKFKMEAKDFSVPHVVFHARKRT